MLSELFGTGIAVQNHWCPYQSVPYTRLKDVREHLLGLFRRL